jgi:site-specific recombinase XerC
MATRDRLIIANPAADVEERPKVDTSDHAIVREQCWSGAEARMFLDTAKSDTLQTAAFFALALDTGARKSELYALTWDRFDLEAGTVTIDRQLVSGRSGADASFAPLKRTYGRSNSTDSATPARACRSALA